MNAGKQELEQAQAQEKDAPVVESPKKKKSWMVRYYKSLSRTKRIILAAIGLISAIFVAYSAFKKIFYDANEDKSTSEEIISKKINNYKELPHFEVTYYLLYDQQSNKVIKNGSEVTKVDVLKGRHIVKNAVLLEYEKSLALTEEIQQKLYVLSIYQNGSLPAKDVKLVAKKLKLSKSFDSTSAAFLNSLRSDSLNLPVVQAATIEEIPFGDISIDNGILFPTLYSWSDINSYENTRGDFNNKTGLLIFVPLKLIYTDPVTGATKTVDIRGVLDYTIKIEIGIDGRG